MSCSCYMPCSYHSWFHHPNNTWWKVQIMKLLIFQFPPATCYFLSRRSYCSQLPVLKHPQSMSWLSLLQNSYKLLHRCQWIQLHYGRMRVLMEKNFFFVQYVFIFVWVFVGYLIWTPRMPKTMLAWVGIRYASVTWGSEQCYRGTGWWVLRTVRKKPRSFFYEAVRFQLLWQRMCVSLWLYVRLSLWISRHFVKAVVACSL
jgi:hypothetical protein